MKKGHADVFFSLLGKKNRTHEIKSFDVSERKLLQLIGKGPLGPNWPNLAKIVKMISF